MRQAVGAGVSGPLTTDKKRLRLYPTSHFLDLFPQGMRKAGKKKLRDMLPLMWGQSASNKDLIRLHFGCEVTR